MNIILVGFKKCGKTTIGKLLAKFLDKNFVDIDDIIETIYRKDFNEDLSCYDIYQKHLNGFRLIEKRAVDSIDEVKNSVIATGGGTLINYENIQTLKRVGKIIYLKSSIQVLEKRILNSKNYYSDQKKPKDFISKTYFSRVSIYEKFSDLIINTDSKNESQIIKEISLRLHGI